MKKRAIVATIFVSIFCMTLYAETNLPVRDESAISIFQPLKAADSSLTKSISVYNQEIKIDFFDDFAVVNANYWFNNTSEKSIEIAVGIPENEKQFSKVYWLRININDRAPFAARDTLLSEHWLTWRVDFQPGITEMSLYYGISSRLSTKMNCLQYDFSNYKSWKTDSLRGDLWMRMNGGLTTADIFGVLPDKKFFAGNSIVHGSMSQLMNDSLGSVLICYRSLDSIPAILSRVSWEMKYSNLTGWNPDKKIIATLQPFSATDFEGKNFRQAARQANPPGGTEWMIGIVLACGILALFIGSVWQRRRAQ